MNLPNLVGSRPSPKATAQDLKEKYASLVLEAEKRGKLGDLESFRECYLKACLTALPPGKVLDFLQESIATFEVARDLERTMDKKHFLDLIQSSAWILSGHDKKGNPILWMKSPPQMYNYKKGTPRANALLRAGLYMFQVALIRSAPAVKLIVMYDDTARSLLDFNAKLGREYLEIGHAMFPAHAEQVHYFASQAVRSTSKFLFTAYQSRKGASFVFEPSKEVVWKIVGNPADIPNWFFPKLGGGVEFQADWNNLWDFERILNDGQDSPTPKEVFNGPLWRRRKGENDGSDNKLLQPLRLSDEWREDAGFTIVDEKAPEEEVPSSHAESIDRMNSDRLSAIMEDDESGE